MQVTITFDTVLDMVKQLSLADQMRLVEWIIRQIKQNFVKEDTPNIAKNTQTNLLTFDSIPQRIPGLHTGTVWMSDDFDAPLPDEFWLGETDEILT
jgi:hypothetical protein